ncbi:trans-2-enoyl-CoA reductase-like protein [Paraburkholderia unamae]|nr:trans-2-enoyl-CoA reductase-like protein [Paraburkholderia unamae]
MIISPRVRGFICVTTHPSGCHANVKEQVNHVVSTGPIFNGPEIVLH